MGKVNNKISIEQEKNLFSEVSDFLNLDKHVQISFSAPDLSSNGGVLLAAKAEKSVGLIKSLSKCVRDWRNPLFIAHPIEEQISQRVYQIACGYEDADDCDLLRGDSILKMSCGLRPGNCDLSSQPTMSRLENHVGHRELYDMGEAFIDSFMKSYGTNIPAKIMLDLDDSNSNTYGAQQLTLFNQYYGEYCYMPLFIFEGYSGRLILPILRPGRTNKQINVCGTIRRLVERIREVWPNTVITIRGDAMFCSHDMFEWADTVKGIHYCVGLTGNSVLLNHPQVLQLKAKAESIYGKTNEAVRLYGQFPYKASSWKASRWVIVKVEYERRGFNIRFIVVDRFPRNPADSKRIYETIYCKRGECELWIKELKDDLHIDRMSCSRFSANQFRVFLHAAAYVLLWHVRHVQLRGTEAESWTTRSLQLRILRSAVNIKEQKTKIKVEFEDDHPQRNLIFRALCRA